uniref:Uncharacterized protein n=1 Tax=Arundo donax TaxID=35708 RepID=A0A0A9B4K8_ARUDO
MIVGLATSWHCSKILLLK